MPRFPPLRPVLHGLSIRRPRHAKGDQASENTFDVSPTLSSIWSRRWRPTPDERSTRRTQPPVPERAFAAFRISLTCGGVPIGASRSRASDRGDSRPVDLVVTDEARAVSGPHLLEQISCARPEREWWRTAPARFVLKHSVSRVMQCDAARAAVGNAAISGTAPALRRSDSRAEIADRRR